MLGLWILLPGFWVWGWVQYPFLTLPFSFNENVQDATRRLCHVRRKMSLVISSLVDIAWSGPVRVLVTANNFTIAVMCTHIYYNTYILYVYQINSHIPCVCVGNFPRSRERQVIAPRCFHQRRELLLAYCIDQILSRHDVWFGKKSHKNCFTGTHETTPFTLQRCNTSQTGRITEKG